MADEPVVVVRSSSGAIRVTLREHLGGEQFVTAVAVMDSIPDGAALEIDLTALDFLDDLDAAALFRLLDRSGRTTIRCRPHLREVLELIYRERLGEGDRALGFAADRSPKAGP